MCLQHAFALFAEHACRLATYLGQRVGELRMEGGGKWRDKTQLFADDSSGSQPSNRSRHAGRLNLPMRRKKWAAASCKTPGRKPIWTATAPVVQEQSRDPFFVPSIYPLTHPPMFQSIDPSIYVITSPCIYHPVYVSIHLSMNPSISLLTCLSIYQCICPSIYLSLYPSIYLFVCLLVCQSINPPMYLSVCLCIYFFVCIHLSIDLSIHVSMYLCIYLSA